MPSVAKRREQIAVGVSPRKIDAPMIEPRSGGSFVPPTFFCRRFAAHQ